jgi:hypothetical protein
MPIFKIQNGKYSLIKWLNQTEWILQTNLGMFYTTCMNFIQPCSGNHLYYPPCPLFVPADRVGYCRPSRYIITAGKTTVFKLCSFFRGFCQIPSHSHFFGFWNNSFYLRSNVISLASNLGNQVPVLKSTSDRLAQLYLQALCSISVAFSVSKATQ